MMVKGTHTTIAQDTTGNDGFLLPLSGNIRFYNVKLLQCMYWGPHATGRVPQCTPL